MAVPFVVSRPISRSVPRSVSDRLFGGSPLSEAALFLATYGPYGMVMDFTDASIAIKEASGVLDFTSQGQVSGGALVGPGAKTTYSAPSAKLTEQADGNLAFQAHNLALWSEDISNVAWNKSNVTVVGSVATATGAAANKFIRQLNLVSGGPSYSIQFDVAAGTHSLVQIYTDTPTTAYANFDLANGVVGTVGATATATIELVSGSTYRCTAVFASTGTNARLAFIDSTSAAWNATSASTGTIIVTRAHLRRTPSVDTYIATTTAAAYDLPYVYSGGALQDIMVEPAATNRNAHAFAVSSWTLKSGVTVTDNTTLAPDGTTTADTLAFTSAGYAYTNNSIVSSTATLPFTGSIWLKGTPGDKVGLRINNANTAVGNYVLITLTANWVRYSVSASIPFTSGNSITMGLETRVGVVPGTGAAVTLQAWGAQVEDGLVATSLIPTYGAAVARVADVETMATGLLPYSATEGTLYVEYQRRPDLFSFGAQFDDGTNNNSTSAVVSDTGNSRALITTGGVGQANVGDVHAAENTWAKTAIAWSANSANVSTNGSIGTEDTSVSLPSVTTLRLGDRASGGRSINGPIRKIAYFPRKFSATELQAITA